MFTQPENIATNGFSDAVAVESDPHYSVRNEIETGNSVLNQFLNEEITPDTMSPAQDSQMSRELEYLEANSASIMESVSNGDIDMAELGTHQAHNLFMQLGNSHSNSGMEESLRNFAQSNPFGLERMGNLLDQAAQTFAAKITSGARFDLTSRTGEIGQSEINISQEPDSFDLAGGP